MNREQRRKNKKHTLESVGLVAAGYTVRSVFEKESPKEYNAAQRNGWLNIVCVHMIDCHESWTIEKVQAEASKFTTRNSFCLESSRAYWAAQRNGWLDQVCAHMIDVHKSWSFEKIQIEASKYFTRSAFQKGSPSAYAIAINNNWLDMVCAHMEESSNVPYTKEEVQVEANKYTTRISFYLGSSGTYRAALRNGWLDEVCAHMVNATNISNPEKELFSAIQSIYSAAKKLSKDKVKIPGKPHIHSFDLDIFIPDLNLGIEFDGTYYHSFKGLKRGRKNWPDEDLLNYHQIKDDHFLSKGIQILHIREEDWSKDKNKEIQKCLNFLKGTSDE